MPGGNSTERVARRYVLGKRRPSQQGIYEADLHPKRVFRMTLMGQTDPELAANLGISERTLKQWRAKYPAFRERMDAGRAQADERVAESLYKRATGDIRLPAVKIFYDKDKGEAVYAPYEEVLPPDVGAAKYWLGVRDPGRWREKKDIEISGTIEHQIMALTPEERLAQLRELQAKVGLLIEGEAVEVASTEETAQDTASDNGSGE